VTIHVTTLAGNPGASRGTLRLAKSSIAETKGTPEGSLRGALSAAAGPQPAGEDRRTRIVCRDNPLLLTRRIVRKEQSDQTPQIS